jgi:hypothetical protein
MRDDYYDTAAAEIMRKELIPSCWAKAFSEAMGNRDLAVALYIKYRVKDLEADHIAKVDQMKAKALQAQRARIGQVSIGCPNVDCNYVGPFKETDNFNIAAFIVLSLCLFIPGILYMIFSGKAYECPKCKAKLSKERYEFLRNG